MKTTSVREAKNSFGVMNDIARAESTLIEKHRCGVVAVVSMEEYERLSVRSGRADKGKWGARGRRKVANEAFARVKIDQLLKDAAKAEAMAAALSAKVFGGVPTKRGDNGA